MSEGVVGWVHFDWECCGRCKHYSVDRGCPVAQEGNEYLTFDADREVIVCNQFEAAALAKAEGKEG